MEEMEDLITVSDGEEESEELNGGRAPQRARKKWKTNKEELIGWGMSCIPIIGFLIFSVIPLGFSIYICFHQFRGLRLNTAEFVGFDNFVEIFTDDLFWKSVTNTLIVIGATLIALVISIIISTLLSNCGKGKKLFQTVYFIPYVCSMVAITFMWQWIFNYNFGVLNALLRNMGLIEENINWLGQESTFMPVMYVILIWGGTGFNIILLSAAMTNVNKNCYEAADIDGAGMFTKFFRITLPAISPTTFYLLVTGLIGSLQTFTQFQVMASDGGPGYAGLTIVFYLYRELFQSSGGSDIGVATAVGWVLALFISVVVAFNFWGSKKWVSYDE